MKVVFIGAGNLATHLAWTMKGVGITIGQVYSHTADSAKTLASRLDVPWTTEIDEIHFDADLYIFSLKDSVLRSVISQMKTNNALWVHTAGSMPIDVFDGHTERGGVLYPLQTFSKERKVDFRNIPLFLETKREEDRTVLNEIGHLISDNVRFLSSEKRKSLHLAAVFACNFTNHIYSLAYRILSEKDIPADVLLPLIDETAAKIHALAPAQAQTGPAIRYDENVINKHLEMLEDPDMKNLYRLISQSIHRETMK